MTVHPLFGKRVHSPCTTVHYPQEKSGGASVICRKQSCLKRRKGSCTPPTTSAGTRTCIRKYCIDLQRTCMLEAFFFYLCRGRSSEGIPPVFPSPLQLEPWQYFVKYEPGVTSASLRTTRNRNKNKLCSVLELSPERYTLFDLHLLLLPLNRSTSKTNQNKTNQA